MVLKRLFGRSGEKKKRKEVTCDELSRILNFEGVDEKEFKHKSSGSFKDGRVKWFFASGHDNIRGGFETINIHIRNLEIVLESDTMSDELELEIRYGSVWNNKVNSVDLHFENCCFHICDVFVIGIKFIPEFEDTFGDPYLVNYPYRGKRFTFSKNIADNGCSFSFPGYSDVTFRQNDFEDIAVRRNDGEEKKEVILDFIGNKFGRLNLDFSFPFEYPVSCNFFGNEIDFLDWDQMVNRRKFDGDNNVVRYDDVQEYSLLRIFFGRNKIISGNRDLFVMLKKLALERKDSPQEKIIDSFIFMISYTWVKKSKWYKTLGEVEERFRLEWCWRSSRFYMSWLWPLGLLIGGYAIFNAIPMLWVDGYSWWKWLEFSMLSPKAIYDYVGSLETVLETEVTQGDKIGLGAMEWGRWIWITLCVFAFGNAIKKK